MNKIDIEQIRTGEYEEVNNYGTVLSGGDYTAESLELIAEKVNEIIEYLTKEQ